MLYNRKSLSLLMGFWALAISAELEVSTARAQDDKAATTVVGPLKRNAIQPTTRLQKAYKPAKPYFIEFRSRSALSYGHTFSVYGRLNAQGKIVESVVA